MLASPECSSCFVNSVASSSLILLSESLTDVRKFEAKVFDSDKALSNSVIFDNAVLFSVWKKKKVETDHQQMHASVS